MAELRSTFKIGLASQVADITSGNLISFPINPSQFNEKLQQLTKPLTVDTFDLPWAMTHYGYMSRNVIMAGTISGTNAESDLDDLKEMCLRPELKKLYVFGTTTGDSRYLIGQVVGFTANRSVTSPVKTIDFNIEFEAFDPCYYNDTEYTHSFDITAADTVTTSAITLTSNMGNTDSYPEILIDPQASASVNDVSLADVDVSGYSATAQAASNTDDAFTSSVDNVSYSGCSVTGFSPAFTATDTLTLLPFNANDRGYTPVNAIPSISIWNYGFIYSYGLQLNSEPIYNSAIDSTSQNYAITSSKPLRLRLEEGSSQTWSAKAGGTLTATNKITVTLTWKKRFW